MIRKSGYRFSEKIMRKLKDRAGRRFEEESSRSSKKPPPVIASQRAGAKRGPIAARVDKMFGTR
jgi:hypothetical protein